LRVSLRSWEAGGCGGGGCGGIRRRQKGPQGSDLSLEDGGIQDRTGVSVSGRGVAGPDEDCCLCRDDVGRWNLPVVCCIERHSERVYVRGLPVLL
jgi:hypothetical protein